MVGNRSASCLLKHEELPVPRGEMVVQTRVGLWLVLVTFPAPLPSCFFLYQHGQEDFLFPPAGWIGKHFSLLEGFFWCDCPSPIPLARTGHLQGAGDSLPLTPTRFSSCLSSFP